MSHKTDPLLKLNRKLEKLDYPVPIKNSIISVKKRKTGGIITNIDLYSFSNRPREKLPFMNYLVLRKYLTDQEIKQLLKKKKVSNEKVKAEYEEEKIESLHTQLVMLDLN